VSVDAYIKKQPSPQKEILVKLRKIILKTSPKIMEEMKMGVPWYEGKFYLVALKDHVNMGFAYGKQLSKYQDQLEGRGKHMRHIKFFSPAGVCESTLVELIKATRKGYRDPHPKKRRR
jgi:hypothetical protein